MRATNWRIHLSLAQSCPRCGGTDAEREAVPGSSDVEQPLPDARRKQHRT